MEECVTVCGLLKSRDNYSQCGNSLAWTDMLRKENQIIWLRVTSGGLTGKVRNDVC